MHLNCNDFKFRLRQSAPEHLAEDLVESFRSIYGSLKCLAVGLMFAVCPVGISFDFESGVHAKVMIVFAKSGSGRDGDSGDNSGGGDGSGSSSGSGGGRDSNSGGGNSGSGGGGHSGTGSGSDSGGGSGSSSGSGNGNGSSSGSGSASSVSSSEGKGKSLSAPRLREVGQNLQLIYSNGWEEKIFNGRYELKDPMGRTVSLRSATQADHDRLRRAALQ